MDGYIRICKGFRTFYRVPVPAQQQTDFDSEYESTEDSSKDSGRRASCEQFLEKVERFNELGILIELPPGLQASMALLRIVPARVPSNSWVELIRSGTCLDRYNPLLKDAKIALISCYDVDLPEQAKHMICSCPPARRFLIGNRLAFFQHL
jgi:hypothetical protein